MTRMCTQKMTLSVQSISCFAEFLSKTLRIALLPCLLVTLLSFVIKVNPWNPRLHFQSFIPLHPHFLVIVIHIKEQALFVFSFILSLSTLQKTPNMKTLTAIALFVLFAHVGKVHSWESFKKLSHDKREWLHRIAVKQG